MTSDRCKRCGHPLTDKISRARGYGPLCWEKVNNMPAHQGRELRRQRLLEFLARDNCAEFTCEQCNEPTPVLLLKHGKCPRCRQVPTKLEELDAVPFAEVH